MATILKADPYLKAQMTVAMEEVHYHNDDFIGRMNELSDDEDSFTENNFSLSGFIARRNKIEKERSLKLG